MPRLWRTHATGEGGGGGLLVEGSPSNLGTEVPSSCKAKSVLLAMAMVEVDELLDKNNKAQTVRHCS